VNSTADPGDGICDIAECTLREAIVAANSNPGKDTIVFNIAGTGPHTIRPTSALPTITDPIIIDGYTQPGATANTNPPDLGSNAVLMIELDGSSTAPTGLRITSGSSKVRGLVVNRFGIGIRLQDDGGNVVEGNFIGTDVTGTMDAGISVLGIRVDNSPANTIGGVTPQARNLVSGFAGGGSSIWIDGAHAIGNIVRGNLIGTDSTGTTTLGGTVGVGVVVSALASGTIIGGTTAIERNIISGRAGGVGILGSDGNTVLGNYIGTDVSGTVALGGGAAAVFIDGDANTIGAPGAGNVISGHRSGVLVPYPGSLNVIQANKIGTDVTGTAALGNEFGASIGGDNNFIGGTAAGAGNVISGNSVGVRLLGRGHRVLGNLIGTDVFGTGALGNTSHGVHVYSGSNHAIGGTAAGAGNTIAYNGGDGVLISARTEASVRGNLIHSNGGMGIRNINNGNMELSPPVITAVGSASGTACANCTIDVYSDDADEGRVYHGSTTADGSGNWSFPGAVVGPNVTATATDADGNTSEFSTPFALPGPTPTPTPTPECIDLNGDGKVSGRDVAIVARALSSEPGERRWNPAADLDSDQRVGLRDLVIVISSMHERDCR
jgi:CSLREA domain-containing protein